MDTEKSFTLTELLVTLVVIAVIAGIAFPGFTKAMRQASARQAADYLRTIAAAERVYYAKWKNFIDLANENSIQELTGANVASNDFNFKVDASDVTFTATATRVSTPTGKITLDHDDTWDASGGEEKYINS